MAKIVGSSIKVETDTASATVSFEPVAGTLAGDHVMLIICLAHGTNCTWSTPAGWTQKRDDRSGSGLNGAIYERLITADGEALPTVTPSVAGQWISAVVVHRGATAIGNVSLNSTSVGTTLKTGPTVTASAAKSSILHIGMLERYTMTFLSCTSPNSRLLQQDITSTNVLNNSDSALVVVGDFAPKSGDVSASAVYAASSSTGTDQLLYAVEVLSDGTNTPAFFADDHTEDIAFTVATGDEARNAVVASGKNPFTGAANVVATFDAAAAVDTALNRVTIPAHGFTHKSIVHLSCASPPAPLVSGKYYYVNAIDADTVAFREANAYSTGTLAGGSWYGSNADIDLTAVGAGTATLTECRWLNHSVTYASATNIATFTQPPNSNLSSWLNLYATTMLFAAPVDLTRAVSTYVTVLTTVQRAMLVFFDVSGNWRAFVWGELPGRFPTSRAIHIAGGSLQFFAEAGAFDSTQVSMVSVALNGNATQQRGYISFTTPLIKLNPLRICGGDVATPITWDDVYQLLHAHYEFSSDSPTGIMYALAHSIIFGDGPNVSDSDVHFDSSDKTVGFFDSYEDGGLFWRKYIAKAITFDLNAASTVVLGRNTFGSSKTYDFSVEATRPAAAVIGFDGGKLNNADVTLRADDTITDAIFIDCPSLTHNDAELIRPNFYNLGSPLVLSTTHQISLAVFNTDTPADLAVRITSAGTYHMPGWVFNGHTIAIDVTATTGTVTIQIAADDDEADYTYQTAGATVVFDQAVSGTSWTNPDLDNGTTILVRNMDTATTIAYVASLATGTGYTISLVPGVDYTVGDEIQIWQSRKNGTTYYQERTSRIITSAAGGAIIEADPLEVCTICTAFALDGAAPPISTKFYADYADDEVDIIVGGAWQMAEAMVWAKTQMTIQASMEDLWGTLIVQADGSFYNPSTSVKPVMFDNYTATDAIESTGRRFYNEAGTRPIRSPTTGTGSLDFSWREPVTVVATGSGVLPADIAAIATASRDEIERAGGMLEDVQTTADAIKPNTSLIPALL